MKEHFRVSGRITAEAYEIAVARWCSIGLNGCEERSLDDGTIEMNAYFSSAGSARAAADDLRATGTNVAVTPVVNEDWNARWRQSMEPAKLAPSWWVAPPWLRPPLGPKDKWIKIEPKMAFGTGHHETTRLAAGMLIDCGASLEGADFLDIGTGSGVLCFTAAMAGAVACTGIEIDRECRENLSENRALNDTAENVSFVIGSIDAISKRARFDLIVMNMIHTEAAPLLVACRGLLKENGMLIWSGILCDEKIRAITDAEAEGFALGREIAENEWWCGRFGNREG